MKSYELKLQRQQIVGRLQALRSEREVLSKRLEEVEKEISEIDSVWSGGKLKRIDKQIAAAEWREWAETLPRVVWVDPWTQGSDRDYRVEKVTAKTMTIVNPGNPERRFVCRFSGEGMPYPVDIDATLAGMNRKRGELKLQR